MRRPARSALRPGRVPTSSRRRHRERTRRPRVEVTLAVVAMVAALMTTAAKPVEAHPSWIVVLEDEPGSVPAVASEMARAHGGDVGFVYEHALRGFSVTLPARAAAALARNPRVAYVQPNRTVTIQAQATPTGIDRAFASGNANLDIDATDDARVDVDVAVIDTGIDFEHPDLDVVGGVTCRESGGPRWSRTASCSSGGDDDHYHGTHVAGTIGAIDNGDGVVGIAPGARLHAVKVLSSSGSGSEAMVVAGIDWVAANAGTIEVANMSLGGSGYSQAEYDAIQGAVEAGVAFAVAAGNDGAAASNFSPAAFDNVLTVSALADFDGAPGGNGSPTCRSDQDDTLADFSNWGSAVDIAAPGVCIRSTYPVEQGGYGTISGTSMASPHAAGALAILASADNPGNASDVDALYDAVVAAGNLDWTDDSGDGTKERLLDLSDATLFAPAMIGDGGGGGGGGGDENQPPTASFVDSCDDLTCSFNGGASSDVDGSIVGYAWNFGDGTTTTGPTATHDYAQAGNYGVTLTVTDDDGATDQISRTVSVTAPPTGDIQLSVSTYKVRGVQHADLSWSGTSGSVAIRRNGTVVATVSGTSHMDSTGQKGGGSATYQVCQAGTTTCSNQVTATW